MEVVHGFLELVLYAALIAIIVVAACAVGCLQRLDNIRDELTALRKALQARPDGAREGVVRELQ